MKKHALCVISLLILAFVSKIQLDSDEIGKRHLPTALKPIEAGYQASSLKQYAFGFDSLLASLLWVEVLQVGSVAPLKSDEVSWEYAQLDAITTLDPRFYPGYAFGSVILSVFRRDKLGGKMILEKWAKRYPTYWRPYHMLGMHYYEELGDYKSAAPLILRASHMRNAPTWLTSLGLRLLSDSGSVYHAISTAIELSKVTRNPEPLLFLSMRVRSLNYNIQKKEFEQRQLKKAAPARLVASEDLITADVPPSIQAVLREKFEFRWDAKAKKAFPLDPDLEKTLEKTGIHVDPNAVKRVQ